MSERKREWAAAVATLSVVVGLGLWSVSLALIFTGVLFAAIAVRKKITAEELATAWLEYRGVERVDQDPETELNRAIQIAHCVLNRLKGRRA